MTDTHYKRAVVTMRFSHETIEQLNGMKKENAADVGLEVFWLRIIRGMASKACSSKK